MQPESTGVTTPDSATTDAEAVVAAKRLHGFLATAWRNRGVFLLITDLVAIIAIFLFCYYLRFYLEFLAIRQLKPPAVLHYVKGAFLLAGIWVFLIHRDGGYESGLRGLNSVFPRLRSLLVNGLYALGLMIIISYMYRGLALSRQVYLMTGVMAMTVMTCSRLALRYVDRFLIRQHAVGTRILVVGMDAQAMEFARRLRDLDGGMCISGFLRWAPREKQGRVSFAGRPIIGGYQDLARLYREQPFDKIVLSSSCQGLLDEEILTGEIIGIMNFCEAHALSLYMLPPSFDVAIHRHEVGSLSGVPLVRLQDASLHQGYAVLKRSMDIAVALAGLVAGAPLWLAIAAAVKLQGPGPVIFSQVRIGLHGRPFRIYKFRTMRDGAERELDQMISIDQLKIPGFKMKGDPRVTRIGRFLRSTGLDEIPQLWNVLKGEMSLIGPRPELPQFVERYTAVQRRRLKAKPGITGYQQVMARGKPLAACIKYDLTYLKYQGFLLDMYILVRTIYVVARGRGVSH